MRFLNQHNNLSRSWFLLPGAFVVIAAAVVLQAFYPAGGETAGATYSRGILHVAIPYRAVHAGAGQLIVEVLDPEDQVLGRAQRNVDVAEGKGRWQEEIKLDKPLPLDDVVWDRMRYRFEYRDGKDAALEGTESISQILRTPVVHILGQQSYLSGGQAAVRVIVTDSKDEIISGHGTVRIELQVPGQKPRLLFTGRLNPRGTTEAQFQFPSGLIGSQPFTERADGPRQIVGNDGGAAQPL